MDVSNPSNFPRMMELYDNNRDQILEDVSGYTLDDPHTLQAMLTCKENSGYILDPHGAIGFQALKDNLSSDEQGVFLETAHPCKFIDTVENALKETVSLPGFVSGLMAKTKSATPISSKFHTFKEYLAK